MTSAQEAAYWQQRAAGRAEASRWHRKRGDMKWAIQFQVLSAGDYKEARKHLFHLIGAEPDHIS